MTDDALAEQPLVSVVVPVHNVAEFLPRCVGSLLAQNHEPLEILLIDDGSTDSSGSLCVAFSNADSRVKAIRQENRGLSGARNSGLAAASGQFVIFIDGDDWLEPGAVTELVREALSYSADIVVAGYFVDTLDARGMLTHSSIVVPPSAVTGTELRLSQVSRELVTILGYAWNKMYRRSRLAERDIVFPEGISLVEDALFNGHALTTAKRVRLLDRAFVHYVQRPRSTLGNCYYTDHVPLRSAALEAMAGVLAEWGLPDTQVEPVMLRLRIDAVHTALISAVNSSVDARTRRERVRQVRDDPWVRSVLDCAKGPNALPAHRRLYAHLLDVLSPWAISSALHAKHALSTSRWLTP